MDLNLEGKVAIITGASRGIGAAIAEGFVKEKACVVIADIGDDCAQMAARIAKEGGNVLSVKTDVAKKSDVYTLVDKTLHKFEKIDILVNNAGVVGNMPFSDIDEAEWDRVQNVNAKGVYMVSRAVVPHMITAKQGKIVNVSSVAGKQGFPMFSHYCASKFSVIGLTQSLALELAGYNINVNAVCPGILRTQMWEDILDSMKTRETAPRNELFSGMVNQIPLGRPQTPEDVAAVVLFLSSDISKNITGESVNISGGMRVD